MFVIRLQSVHTSTLGRICLRTRNTQNTLMRTTLPATVNSTCEGHPSRQVRTCVQGCYKTNISFVWIIFNRCVFHSRRKCLNHALLAFLTVKQARSCLNVAFQFRVIEFELVENSQNSQWNSLVVTNVKYKYGLYIDQLEASISLRPTHPSPGLSPGIWLCTRARGMENYTILILPSEGWVILTGFVLCSGRLRVGFFLFCEDRRVFKGQDFAFLSELLRRKGLPKKVSLIYLSPQTIEAENLCFRWGF